MLEFISKLIQKITLQAVLLFGLTSFIMVIGYTAFEHRREIFVSSSYSEYADPIKATAPFVISGHTKTLLKEIVETDRIIIGAAIFSVDIRLNLRNVLFYYDEKSPKAEVLESAKHFPFLTQNIENNRQMVHLINGEFVCVPFTKSIMQPNVVEGNQAVISVCRTSLPPYYGNFNGYIVFYLSNDPTIVEQVRLKNQMDLLSTEVYFHDVLPIVTR